MVNLRSFGTGEIVAVVPCKSWLCLSDWIVVVSPTDNPTDGIALEFTYAITVEDIEEAKDEG